MTVDLESRKASELAELLHRYTSEDLPNFDGQPVTEVNQVGVFGDAPLHIAAIRGSLDDVHVLVENGAVINCKGEMARTPLHEAVSRGFHDVARYLVSKGAVTDVVDDFNLNPMDVAVQRGDRLMVAILQRPN